MSSILRVAHTITPSPPEAAGGSMLHWNGTELFLEGFGVPFLREMVVILNISIWNTFGNYSEAVTMVIDNIADMGSLAVSHDVFWTKFGLGSAFVYSHPVIWESSNIYFREPPLIHYKTAIFQPFLPTLWFAYVFLFLSVTSLLLLLAESNNTSIKPKYKTFRFLRLIIETMELCIARSHYSRVHPQHSKLTDNVTRNVKIVMEFCGTYFIAIYTAKVVSVLMLKEHRIKSPEDLVTHGYTISSYNSLHIDRIFGNSKTREIVQRSFQKVKSWETIEHVLGVHAQDPRQALISHPDGFYPQAVYGLHYEQELCRVSSFEGVRKTPRCYYIRKDSSFRKKINMGITLMKERGFTQRLYKAWQQHLIFKCTTQDVTVYPITFYHVEFIIYGLIAGLTLGLLVHFC